MGLVQKILENRGKISLAIGFGLEMHMVYQYVYINQCRHTALTGIEKFAGLVLMVYGICRIYKDKRDKDYKDAT